jgi:hypothetical protein
VATLELSSEPGFTEIPENTYDAGNPITAATAKALNANAAFAAVRSEEFWGYYRHGETVALPISDADGYTYAREELRYVWSLYATSPSTGALNGTQDTPSLAAPSGAGTPLKMLFQVDQDSGAVSCAVNYYKNGGAETPTNDGILVVMTLAKRLR